MPMTIEATVLPKTGFAAHQNAVPLLRELRVTNDSEGALADLTLTLSADPPFLSTRTWRIDRLDGHSFLQITDRDVALNAAFLGDLSESLRGLVTLRLTQQEELLAEVVQPVELLARHEWGGGYAMAELLPAFVMPNDPAVDRILKAASDVLRRAGRPDGLDGYKGQSRERVWELASAIWSAVCGFRISYSLPPASFEQSGQKIRPPSAILGGLVATCLDTALLFAAALEQAGLNPLVILTKGHAFAGLWLQPIEFPTLLTDEAAALRRCIDVHDLLVFETTLATQKEPPPFSAAVKSGERKIAENAVDPFDAAIDIRRGRMQKIRPISQHLENRRREPDAPAVSEALESAPDLPAFDVEVENKTSNPEDRVTVWQRRLLNLTASNRLLNLPERSKVIRLLCPDPASLEDMLSNGRKVRIVALPDLGAGGRDELLYEAQTHENLREQYARDAMTKGEVVSQLADAQLDSALIELYRDTKTDMEEGGANTLFLALGFLKWKKSPKDERIYRAPLILCPVKLERKSAGSGVVMSQHEDDVRFNLTLLEMLREDFELSIPELAGPLPTDDNGVDVESIWRIMRRAVRDVPGFEVSEETALGTFSFAKYLMWKDMVDRADRLRESRVVRHLLDRQHESFASQGDLPRAEHLDGLIDPATLFTPLPADSSQLAAVVASANGQDFVLDGPPGTGKSQTIANMIAHNLALGRRVLFVAEKMAALNVVHRRLTEKGLGEFCLELHSNKANKADVLKQLDRAWTTRDSMSAEEWTREAAKAKELRDGLNDIVGLLHQQHPNGLTLHQAIGRVVRDELAGDPRLVFAPHAQHSEQQLNHLRDIARRLALARVEVATLPAAFNGISQTDWSNAWQDELSVAARQLLPLLDTVGSTTNHLLQLSRFNLPTGTEEQRARLQALVARMLATHGHDLRIAFVPNFTLQQRVAREAFALIESYKQTESTLSTPYAPEAVRRLDLSRLRAEWAEAGKKFWFLGRIAQKKLARVIAQQAGAIKPIDFEGDISKLDDMLAQLNRLDPLSSQITAIPGWNGLATDHAHVESLLELANHLRDSATAAATDRENLIELRRAVTGWVIDANELLAPEGILSSAWQRYVQAQNAAQEPIRNFLTLIGSNNAETGPDQCATLREQANLILQNLPRLKSWADWRRVREEALIAGLAPLLQAVECMESQPSSALVKRITGMFETGYARWFASQRIDAEPKLRAFSSSVHMDDIAAFRDLDDRLAELAVKRIRAGICGQIPSKEMAGNNGGYGVLRHQLQLQKRHKPIRQLATEMGDAFTRLAPCMMMSPLSIAQYLPADQALFDLVIFDEASQIPPWDAIGAMARGKQVVVAGDPRQMPPTNFFGRTSHTNTDDGTDNEDLDSILEECLAAGVPQLSLSWHYRSRHESLIAFSNHRYYNGALVTFPAATTRKSAVEWRRVDGVYARGQTRTNTIEAQTIVDEAVQMLIDPAFVQAKKTLGIITLNAEQQKLVEDLLDRARIRHPEIEPHFNQDRTEPVVVKNLETVQGDERDVIFLGICFGPTEQGAPTMKMNFGPFNGQGGWRRLNVAVTRARQEMRVFTSFDPGMIDLTRTGARAVRDLKHFIEFAARGPVALAEAIQGSVGGYDSPFEEAVAQQLTKRGWIVVPQIGVSRFRIDLGIVHPDHPGDYLLGVECDGATYHSAATARDRDKVRGAILASLGWNLLRVWSTDWWIDKQGATEKLHAAMNEALEISRQKAADAAEKAAAAPFPVQIMDTSIHEFAEAVAAFDLPVNTHHYRVADLSTYARVINPEAFYEPSYDNILLELVRHVIAQEAPISETQLVQRIARAHGFQRAGRIIRERVMAMVARYHHVIEEHEAESFIWPDRDTPAQWQHYRTPASDNDVRSIEDIAGPELQAALRASDASDKAVDVARMFGIRRLSSSTRQRIERFMGET